MRWEAFSCHYLRDIFTEIEAVNSVWHSIGNKGWCIKNADIQHTAQVAKLSSKCMAIFISHLFRHLGRHNTIFWNCFWLVQHIPVLNPLLERQSHCLQKLCQGELINCELPCGCDLCQQAVYDSQNVFKWIPVLLLLWEAVDMVAVDLKKSLYLREE